MVGVGVYEGARGDGDGVVLCVLGTHHNRARGVTTKLHWYGGRARWGSPTGAVQ